MANVQGTFYTATTQRRGVTPVSPPNAVDDPINPVLPPIGSHPAVTIGTPANGLSIDPSTQVLSIGLADENNNGALTSEDWQKIQDLEPPAPQEGLVTRGTITFDSPTSVDIDGYEWNYEGVLQEGGLEENKTIPGTPTEFNRIDALVGDNAGSYHWIEGTEDENQVFEPAIPSDRRILEYILRTPSGDNTLEPVEPDLTIYVDKISTGTQTIQSDLASVKWAKGQNDYLRSDPNGKIQVVRGDKVGVRTTIQGSVGWARAIRINCNFSQQLNYGMTLELSAVESNDYQTAKLTFYLRFNGSGVLQDSSLLLFGKVTPARYKIVKIDTDTYELWLQHFTSLTLYVWRPLFSFGGIGRYTLYNNQAITSLPSGDQLDFVDANDLSEILSDINYLEVALLALEGVVDDHEERIDELETRPYLIDVIAGTNVTIDKTDPKNPIINATGGGGGGGTTGRTELTGFPVIPFDKEYYYTHEMSGPVEISVNTTLPRSIPNNTILYVKANGTDKPTFKTSDNFSIVLDGWNNTAGEWNRIQLEWSPQGNPVVQIMDTSGDANPGTGATVITLTFDEDDSFSHVITGTVSLSVDTTGAVVAKRVIGWFQADGTNKPMWSSPIECNYDTYVNEAGIWNRFYLEWTPENKVTLQIQNT
jgi:hypothetical protein